MTRRGLGLLLAVYMLVGLVLPALSLAQESTHVPACCRRAGIHHCVMSINLPGEGFRAQPCAQFPAAYHALISQQKAAPIAAACHVDLRSASAPGLRKVARAMAGSRRCVAARGPPVA